MNPLRSALGAIAGVCLLAACGADPGAAESSQPIVATSKAVLFFDASTYRTPATVTVTVADADLNRKRNLVERLGVRVTSPTSVQGESIILTETGLNTGVFTATFPISASDYEIVGNGTVEVKPGDPIVATYVDQNDGTGHQVTIQATAVADGTPDLVADYVSAVGSITGSVDVVQQLHADLNGGPVPANTSRVYVSLDPVLDANDTLLVEQPIPSLLRGQYYSSRNTLPLDTFPAGTFYLISVQDALDAVAELSEANNVKVSAPLTLK